MSTTELVQLIDAFLKENLSFEDFQRRYYDLYLELPEEPGETAGQERFFSDVHEWLDWTTIDPPAADRTDGWHDPGEFRSWLGKAFSDQIRKRP